MTPTRLTRRAVMAGATAFAAVPALAHRLARTETDVRIAEDGTVGVTHVYHLQDAQSALFEAGLIDAPDLGSLRAQARLALYTEEHFALLVDGRPSPLSIVGAEIEGDSVFVYQEGSVAPGPLSVKAGMLRDLLERQINSVNVVRGGRTVTLDFKGDDGVKALSGA